MDTKIKLRKAGLLLAYPVAYLYLRLIITNLTYYFEDVQWWMALTTLAFALIFIGWNEVVRRSRKEQSKPETRFWYIVMVLAAVTTPVSPSPLLSLFALHLGAVYSVAVSNGTICEGKTGRFIVMDLLDTGLVKTFPKMGNLFDDAKIVKNADTGEKGKASEGRGAAILMILGMIPVLVIVLALLSSLNEEFAQGLIKILEYIDFVHLLDDIGPIMARLIFAVPICLFLYAMLSACANSDGSAEKAYYARSVETSAKMRKVAAAVTGTIAMIFDVIYFLFFVLEGKYLFGGIFGELPEGYSLCSYARSGFFELTAIMAINLGLYLMVRMFGRRDKDGHTEGYVKYALTVLLSESALFAVLSFTKIFMYFYEFGYTPKRMLSMWGALILGAGALLLIVTLFRKKDMSRIWIIFTSVSYIVICILSGILDFLF